MKQQTVTCGKCLMKLEVVPFSNKGGPERLRCPDCTRPFWAGRDRAAVVYCRIEPSRLHEWESRRA